MIGTVPIGDTKGTTPIVKRVRTTLLLRHQLQSLDPSGEKCHAAVIQPLDPTQASLLAEINPEIELDLEMAKFAEGLKCFVASVDHRLAHYAWVQDYGVHRIGGAGRMRRVRTGNFWIHACFTADWARGRHIYPTVLRRILHHYRERGFRTAWIYVLDSNVASRKGIAYAGFELVSQLRSLAIGNLVIPIP